MLGIPEPQHSQGRVLLEVVKGGSAVKPISIIGLNDFHGQLDPTTLPYDGIMPSVGGASFLATMFDEELGDSARARADPGRWRQRRRIAAELGAPRGHARHRRRERVGPRRHLVRQPRVRLRRGPAAHAPGAGRLPVPRHEHRRDGDRQCARLGYAIGRLHRQRHQGRRHRRRAQEHAGARLRGRNRRPDLPRRGAAHRGGVPATPRARRQGPGRRHPPGDERRPEPDRQHGRRAVGGPDPRYRRRPPGHDSRRDDRRPYPPDLQPDARPHPHHRGDQRRRRATRSCS